MVRSHTSRRLLVLACCGACEQAYVWGFVFHVWITMARCCSKWKQERGGGGREPRASGVPYETYICEPHNLKRDLVPGEKRREGKGRRRMDGEDKVDEGEVDRVGHGSRR